MIQIVENRDCCGCGACAQVCPKRCITMFEDREGFLYPRVDAKSCVECSLCERVCPTINQSEQREPIATYAAKSRNEQERENSSSGGIFSTLAREVIDKQGVVFGAKFDASWEVVHTWAENMDDVALFRGSKYLQSRIENSFSEAKKFLESNREVLFSGTPCQIAGLKLFLGKEYAQLTTVDFICHGTPSPKVWRGYLKSLTEPCGATITGVTFRDKSRDCRRFSIKIEASDRDGKRVLVDEPMDVNLYQDGFRRDIYLRPSCYACPTKSLKSGSDITLGDFWGIEKLLPSFDDMKGISLVTANSNKGQQIMQALKQVDTAEASYKSAIKYNPSGVSSPQIPPSRTRFFEKIDTEMIEELKRQLHLRPHTRLARFAKRVVYNTLKIFKIKR